jgi:hypothetical protein
MPPNNHAFVSLTSSLGIVQPGYARVQRETRLNDAGVAARGDARSGCWSPPTLTHTCGRRWTRGSSSTKVTRSGSGCPQPGRSRRLPRVRPGWPPRRTAPVDGAGRRRDHRRPPRPGGPRRPSPPLRRRCATRAGSSGSPPARPGRGCVARARVESTTGGCVHFLPNTGLGRQIWQPQGLSGRKWRQGPAVPRPAARPRPA